MNPTSQGHPSRGSIPGKTPGRSKGDKAYSRESVRRNVDPAEGTPGTKCRSRAFEHSQICDTLKSAEKSQIQEKTMVKIKARFNLA